MPVAAAYLLIAFLASSSSGDRGQPVAVIHKYDDLWECRAAANKKGAELEHYSFVCVAGW
jgi:hypothetical protein